jgi:hypothetical protein
VSGPARSLARVSRALASRRVLAAGLAGAGAACLFLAAAALAAWGGLFAAARWGPLLAWLLLLALLAALARFALRLLWKPRVADLRLTAAAVERELTLRRGLLAGAVDLARGAPPGTSDALAARAAAELERALPAARAGRWAPETTRALNRRVRAAALAAAGGALALAGAFALAGEAAAALVSPLAALRAARGDRVFIEVSAREVPAGGSATVTVRAAPLLRPALLVRATGRTWRRVDLEPDASGLARHVLSGIRSPLFVFARAGEASSDTVRIGVVTAAFLAEFMVTARYPAYLGRSSEALAADAGPLELPVGTELDLSGAASEPLAAASLAAGSERLPLAVDGRGFGGVLVVRGSARWQLALADRLGSGVEGPLPVLDVRAVPDSAPVVSVPVPGADTTAPLDLQAAIVIDARDDHGLARVEILSWRVSRLGVVGDTVVDTLSGVAGADRVVQGRTLDLTERGLLPGDTLRFFVRAADQAPTPHWGRSREYALRLITLAELREAVRERADALASEAGELAREQSRLARQTEDLAHQRNRSQGPARPEARQVPGAERRPPPGSVPFEQAEEAQRVAERQQQLTARAESLRQDLERLARAAEAAGLNDPEWQDRLRQLEELMREAITEELRQRLEELRRALERLDPRAVQEALRRLTEEQSRLREELERSAELFERAAIEGAMQTFAQHAEGLRHEQELWAQRAPARPDSAAAAAEERRLLEQADSLRRGLEELARRVGRRGDSAGARGLEQAGEQVERAESAMQLAADAMQRGERSSAGERGREAAEALRQVPRQLREQQREMSAAWRAEVLRLLDNALSETVTLAAEEQQLAQELRRGAAGPADARGRQSALELGINQLVRQLQEAAGRNALVSSRLGSSLGAAREQAAQSRQALEGPSPSPDESADRAMEAARRLSAAAYQMLRNREQVAGAQSGSGLAEAIEQMAQLAGQMGQINDQLGRLLPMFGPGQEVLLQQLRELASRQRQLANELERLAATGIGGSPDQLAEEARDLADRLERGRLDRGTLERQQRLFRRMLDAGRSLRQDEPDQNPERQSRTAQELPVHLPALAAPSGALRYPPPPWSVLRALSPAERAMVLDYFRRLNGSPR